MTPGPSSVMPTCVALVPARAGSKRVPGKNIRRLGGHPLIAYTLAAALESRVFSAVVVSTESEEIARIARHYAGDVPFLRKPDFAGDLSPDIDWIEFTLQGLRGAGRSFDCFSILRPTSPFRQASTIQRAWGAFLTAKDADSLRAVEPCKQHPGKMWVMEGAARMRPLLEGGPKRPPWHSTPYQGLPTVYAQNASLEIAWSRVALEEGSISGEMLVPFLTQGVEGFDINGAHDWIVAEYLVASGEGQLPRVPQEPYEERP